MGHYKSMNTVDTRASYTSADSIPLKVLLDQDVVYSVCNKKIIPPVHVQLSITNKCNMSCDFCSMSKRDRKLELSLEECIFVLDTCNKLGTKAITHTGGGEFLMHKQAGDVFKYAYNLGIKNGLVTNGLLLNTNQNLDTLTWCRISNGDERNLGGLYKSKLHTIVNEYQNVDWAFSHVCSESPNLDEIARIVEFANEHSFTHVRLVSDLFHIDEIDLTPIKIHLHNNKINDDIVIYQGRKTPEIGGDCFICYLKPFIAADGNVYNCCSVQYTLEIPSYDFPKELCLGNVMDLESIINNASSIPFDGSICKRCYYMNYNRILGSMLKELKHKEFV